jgi:hypothetical protein
MRKLLPRVVITVACSATLADVEPEAVEWL